ncbi:hypothetical protein Ancab_031753 [Ancistrocladus abbreviatus]
MASWQEKIKGAEEAARFAAQEIKEAREADDQTEQQNRQQQQQSTGFLGKLQEGTASLLKAARDAIIGKSHEVCHHRNFFMCIKSVKNISNNLLQKRFELKGHLVHG